MSLRHALFPLAGDHEPKNTFSLKLFCQTREEGGAPRTLLSSSAAVVTLPAAPGCPLSCARQPQQPDLPITGPLAPSPAPLFIWRVSPRRGQFKAVRGRGTASCPVPRSGAEKARVRVPSPGSTAARALPCIGFAPDARALPPSIRPCQALGLQPPPRTFPPCQRPLAKEYFFSNVALARRGRKVETPRALSQLSCRSRHPPGCWSPWRKS